MFGFNNLIPYNNGGQKQNFLDSFFNEPFLPMFMGSDLKTDIRESEKEYNVNVEIPGVEKKDISINYDANDVLSVGVSRTEEKKEEKNGFLRKERSEGACRREFYLPGVDARGIKARYENGVLAITLPKLEGSEASQNIEIE